MLRPTKFSDPSATILPISGTVLSHLRSVRIESFTVLRKKVQEKHPDTDRLFLPAVSLLFVLGLVVYRTKTDSFEYAAER